MNVRPAGQVLPRPGVPYPGLPPTPTEPISRFPTVNVMSPAEGDVVIAGSPLVITVTYGTGVGYLPIQSIEFLVNGQVVGRTEATASAGPDKTATTQPLEVGSYQISARARDERGVVATAPAVTVLARAANPADCAPPPSPLTTQADIDAWNTAHPACPPISLPGVRPPVRPGIVPGRTPLMPTPQASPPVTVTVNPPLSGGSLLLAGFGAIVLVGIGIWALNRPAKERSREP